MNLLTGPFLTQFERHDDGWVYRENGRGAPIPLSIEERDRFATIFGRWMVVVFIGYMLAVIVLSMIFSAMFPDAEGPLGPVLMMIGIGALLLVTVKWAMHAPSRALADRPTVGPARTKQEQRARFNLKRDPKDIALTGIGFLIAGIVAGRDNATVLGIAFALGIAILLWAAVLKLRAAR